MLPVFLGLPLRLYMLEKASKCDLHVWAISALRLTGLESPSGRLLRVGRPHFFKHGSGDLMVFAAFSTQRGEFVILTRDANDSAHPIHDIMPVILGHAQLLHCEAALEL
jgi:hypothetical protein